MREGEVGDVFTEALELADGLLEELAQAQLHIVGKPWLQAATAAALVFASVGLHGDAAAAAIDALHDTLQAVADARPELERPCPSCRWWHCRRRQPWSDRRSNWSCGTDTLDFDNADADRIRALPIGTWLDFIDKDARVQAGKLSGSARSRPDCCSSTVAACVFCVASPEELAVMVRLGRLRMRGGRLGAFDSACRA